MNTRITIQPNGFAGEYAVVKKGTTIDDQNFGREPQFDVEPSTKYEFVIRGGVAGDRISFETNSQGLIKKNAISPSSAATSVGKTLELTVQDVTIRRGDYRGKLWTNANKPGTLLDFCKNGEYTVAMIQTRLLVFDTTAMLGCSTFRGTLGKNGIVKMSLVPEAVDASIPNEVTLQTATVGFRSVNGEQLEISGLPKNCGCAALNKFCLIRGVCVRVTMRDSNKFVLGSFDFTTPKT